MSSKINRAVVLLRHACFWLFGLFISSIVCHKESSTLDLFCPETKGWGGTYFTLSDRKMYFKHPENLSVCIIVAKIIASEVFSHCFLALGIIVCCGQCERT